MIPERHRSIHMELKPQFLWVSVPGPGSVAGVNTARIQLLLSAAVSALLLILAGLAYRESRRSAFLGLHIERRRHLAGLGEMAAILAHEIRNPVAVARGYAQLLLERMDYEKDQAVRMPAEAVLKETERLGRLVEQLLSYARPHTPAMVSLDLSQIVKETAEIHAGMAAEKNIGIICEGIELPVKMTGDKDMLSRLLGNLVRNAIQASPPGGAVVMQVRKVVGRLEVRVIDQGPGVSDELAERIFEPFFTTTSDGSGLGLAVARRLAEEHGGTLTMENSRERQGGAQGAVFRLSLPNSLLKNRMFSSTTHS